MVTTTLARPTEPAASRARDSRKVSPTMNVAATKAMPIVMATRTLTKRRA